MPGGRTEHPGSSGTTAPAASRGITRVMGSGQALQGISPPGMPLSACVQLFSDSSMAEEEDKHLRVAARDLLALLILPAVVLSEGLVGFLEGKAPGRLFGMSEPCLQASSITPKVLVPPFGLMETQCGDSSTRISPQ